MNGNISDTQMSRTHFAIWPFLVLTSKNDIYAKHNIFLGKGGYFKSLVKVESLKIIGTWRWNKPEHREGNIVSLLN